MRLEAVGKRYGVRQPWVVREVSIPVTPGRLIRLEGRNGSGKSTLLRLAAGVLAPTAGRVAGRPTVGYVPERFPPALPFSGRDYLMHLGRAHGLRGPALTTRVDEYLARFGAAEYARTPLRHLSKGMCQKMAIGQALLARPGLLVLDEAWTGLDEAARDELDAVVAERIADGGRVMFVDHDRRRLAGLVGERWRLARGEVTVAEGPDPVGVGAADQPVVVIELAGVSAGLIAALRAMPGVRSVTQEPERLLVHSDHAVSDAVLRAALAGAGVHVRSVRAGSVRAGSVRAGGQARP
jgi:ABC-2 type transport system ATP-binding protein